MPVIDCGLLVASRRLPVCGRFVDHGRPWSGASVGGSRAVNTLRAAGPHAKLHGFRHPGRFKDQRSVFSGEIHMYGPALCIKAIPAFLTAARLPLRPSACNVGPRPRNDKVARRSCTERDYGTERGCSIADGQVCCIRTRLSINGGL